MGVIITGIKTVQSELYQCIYHNNCRWDLQDLLPEATSGNHTTVQWMSCYRGDTLVSCDWLERKVLVKQVNEFLLLKRFETDLLVDPDSNNWQRHDLFEGCCFWLPLPFMSTGSSRFYKTVTANTTHAHQWVMCRRGDTVACVFVCRIVSKQFLKVHVEVKIRSKEYSASLRQGSLTFFFLFCLSFTRLRSISIFRNSAEDHTHSEPFSRWDYTGMFAAQHLTICLKPRDTVRSSMQTQLAIFHVPLGLCKYPLWAEHW